jgi:predicted DNA-binding helix-hairpin-helix protein
VEILSTSEHLYRHERLTRTYFSAFSPIEDTPLENVAAASPLREHRLYQASFLFRDYGFTLEEMPFSDDGFLPLDEDPKLAWAKLNLFETPVEINRASRDELLRVPGIGLKSAQAILTARRKGTLRDLRDLQQIGVRTGRLENYVTLAGARPRRLTQTSFTFATR